MVSCPTLDPIVMAGLHPRVFHQTRASGGGSFQEAEDDCEPEDWMADDEVEHAEYDDGAGKRRQRRKLGSRGREKHRRIEQDDSKKCQQPSLDKQFERSVVGLELLGRCFLPYLLGQVRPWSKAKHRGAHALIVGFRPEVKPRVPLVILVVERLGFGFYTVDRSRNERDGTYNDHRQPDQGEAY